MNTLNKTNEQLIKNNKNRSREVELPAPEKINEESTSGINKDIKDKTKEKDQSQRSGNEKKDEAKKKKEKRGSEHDRLKRDDPTNPKPKKAEWPSDKINEAYNQPNEKVIIKKDK